MAFRAAARAAALVSLVALVACTTLPDSDALLQPCRNDVSLQNRRAGGVEVVAASTCHVPVLMELSLAEVRNLEPSQPLPARFVVAAGETRRLLTLAPVDAKQPSNYRAAMQVIFGTTPSAPDPAARYAFPFGGSEPRKLVQGNDGAFTHTGAARDAFDFALPRGTPVVAAREGVVLLVVDGFPDGGPDPKFRNRGNGVPVRLGQRVRAGDRLGSSGNSGQSQGPHLHFQVSAQRFSQPAESIPIVFRGDVVPVEGQTYGPYPGAGAEAAR